MRNIYSLLLLLVVLLSLGQCRHQSPAVGESCTELVRDPNRCDEPEEVTESVEPAEETERFGPNVCVTERTELVNASDYVVERSCRFFGFRFRCKRVCVLAETCSVRNVSSRVYDCCPGFAAHSGRNHGFGYSIVRHPGMRTLQREGCPLEIRDSVASCLEDLELSDFAAALERIGLSSRLAGADEELTVFAPVNEAINGAFLSQRALNAHVIADDVVRNRDLRNGAVLRPLAESTLLHVTDEHARDMGYTEVTFINGAEVNTSDACVAENGVVHTLNAVIPSSPDSIAELLRAESQFSDFVQLLDATNITQFLDNGRNTSRTVFAPTNNAFADLPEGALECLTRPENSRVVKKLVLLHISAPAQYTSSLSLRSFIYTFHPRYSLLVCVINGSIHLTRDNVPLEETDFTARNGVIHSLGSVLLADMIDFQHLCPPGPIPPVPVQPPEPGETIQPQGPPVPPEQPEVSP
jgi:uncharacterized surface protein with fasciclin (FAS1) repeats